MSEQRFVTVNEYAAAFLMNNPDAECVVCNSRRPPLTRGRQMTLAEFIELAKSAGVREDDQIGYIDIREPHDGQIGAQSMKSQNQTFSSAAPTRRGSKWIACMAKL